MNTRLYAQIIKTSWTKSSRGGALATTRNAVPLALPMPDLQGGTLQVQHLFYSEGTAFKSPSTKSKLLDITPELRYEHGSFALDWNGVELRTELRDSDWYLGAPGIKSTNPKIGHYTLESGQWVRLRWQGRFSDWDTGNWWYEHTCINVAHFEGNEQFDLFLKSEPTHQFIHLPQLR